MADTEIPDAPTINRQLTTLVLEAGRRLGFEVASEYPIPGGRLDIVWLCRPAAPLPNFDGAIPVVGFEIESSWRSRKHVKGDLLNLQDAGVALGVIVLAGSGEKDESLRRFAQALVDRPGIRVLIWTEGDVHALIDGKLSTELPFHLVDGESTAYERAEVEEEVAIRSAQQDHSGKYRPLWEWLLSKDHRPISVTFADIEGVLGFQLPDSCRSHPAHWHSYSGSAVARAIIDAGWRAHQVQVNAGTVTFAPQ